LSTDVSKAVFRVAETDEEKEAVFRLRYDVYVEEMGRYHSVADHDNRLFIEPEDDNAHLFYVELDGETVATARMNWGNAISQRQITHYSLQRFVDELPIDSLTVGERAMVRPNLRGTTLMMSMMMESLRFLNEHRIQLFFGACEPHLLNLYLGLGQRAYSRKNINSAEAGYLIPLVLIPEDVDYLRELNSPFAKVLQDYGDDARIPDNISDLLAEGGSVFSRTLASPTAYRENVHATLNDLNEHRISAFDGMTEDEEATILSKSNIIHCNAGDRVLKKGGVARNLFVVRQGPWKRARMVASLTSWAPAMFSARSPSYWNGKERWTCTR